MRTAVIKCFLLAALEKAWKAVKTQHRQQQQKKILPSTTKANKNNTVKNIQAKPLPRWPMSLSDTDPGNSRQTWIWKLCLWLWVCHQLQGVDFISMRSWPPSRQGDEHREQGDGLSTHILWGSPCSHGHFSWRHWPWVEPEVRPHEFHRESSIWVAFCQQAQYRKGWGSFVWGWL